jgi:glucosamine 6-phosphate synthetase-like amidotransferase/phosphosugar isomerase protein
VPKGVAPVCGIAGFSASSKAAREPWVTAAFATVLDAASSRGTDAAGMALVRPDGALDLARAALPSPAFVRRHDIQRLLWREPALAALGHARAASVGRADSVENAHPFMHGHVALVHNGNFPGARSLAQVLCLPVVGDTDSEAMAALLARDATERPLGVATPLARRIAAIESSMPTASRGAWAVAAIDTRDPDSVFLATNGGRPLVFLELGGAVFFASTRDILASAFGKAARQARAVDPGATVVLRRGRVIRYVPGPAAQTAGPRALRPVRAGAGAWGWVAG